jgi:hypothetical protein
MDEITPVKTKFVDKAYSGSTVKWDICPILVSTDSDQGNILLLLAETRPSANLVFKRLR